MKVEICVPIKAQLKYSECCKSLVFDAIKNAQGPISFEEYMHICLYADGVGYYQSQHEIFGEQGDFTTSPERSHYFASAFAFYFKQLRELHPDIEIIEIGAGSGKFACDLIQQLQLINCLPARYTIIEKSAALRKKQQESLSPLFSICEFSWQQHLDKPVDCAMVIGNEVLDALPVRLVSVKNGKIKERCVSLSQDEQLEFVQIDADEDLKNHIQEKLPKYIIDQSDVTYNTDINLQIDNFIQQIASFVKRGIFFYIDYGYPRSEYYHEQRNMGTLICHYKHTANDQPLLWPGLQDISCSVDFTSLAEAADKAGLYIDCYSTQANFLLASGILNNFSYVDRAETISEQVELKRLLMPSEMGERFQVMVLSKQMDLSLYQFTMRNLLHRL